MFIIHIRKLTTAFLKWRVDDTVIGRENAGWTRSKSAHPCVPTRARIVDNAHPHPPSPPPRRKDWNRISAGSSLMPLPHPPPHPTPTTHSVNGLN